VNLKLQYFELRVGGKAKTVSNLKKYIVSLIVVVQAPPSPLLSTLFNYHPTHSHQHITPFLRPMAQL
jgi:hypothetical protein